jgi:hypothetical protein
VLLVFQTTSGLFIYLFSNFIHLAECGRYRPRNLLLTKISPGPHDETADEFQRSMAAVVTELLALYEEGIFVQTPKYTKGMSFRTQPITV